MNSRSERLHDRFATTRWSVVMRHGATESTSARDALVELARRYWYPVYIYIRRCGHAPDAARSMARAFLQQLLREVDGGHDQPSQGHYRSYLLARLNTFLAAGPAAADGPPSQLEVPADLEARYERDHLDVLSPEQSYQRAFALQILHRTLRRLTEEARQTGHLPMFEELLQFLARDPAPGEYESIATRLRVRPLTLVMALKRLRQRFRELAGEELADTVASEADLTSEQEALLAVLGTIRS